MDATKSAQSYLDSVSRENSFPPSSSSSHVDSISFLEGGSSAEVGVGGMNGAQTILKAYDAEVQQASFQRSIVFLVAARRMVEEEVVLENER
eukprot:9790009-Ditylum_brightwellii.AAC.1